MNIKDYPYKISFRVTTKECANNMLGLIRMLQSMGILGSSRLIGAIDEDKWNSFLFDGDGNHKIGFIEVEIDD